MKLTLWTVTRFVLFLALLSSLGLNTLPSRGEADQPQAPDYGTDPFISERITISNTDTKKDLPAVAYDPLHDRYLVVWKDFADNGNTIIKCQFVSGTGSLLNTPFILGADETNNRAEPDVAFDYINQRFLVVYSINTPPGTDWDIYGSWVPWNGTAETSTEFEIQSWPAINQDHPSVAANWLAQEFLVAWTSQPVGVPSYISGRRIDAHVSLPATYSTFVIASGEKPRRLPDVATNMSTFEYMVAYELKYSDSDIDIYATNLYYTGSPVIPDYALAESEYVEDSPALAACSNAYPDPYLVAYNKIFDSDPDMIGRFIRQDFLPDGSDFDIEATEGWDFQADATCSVNSDEFMVVWVSEYDDLHYGITGRRMLGPDKEPRGFVIEPSYGTDSTHPAVAGAPGRYLVVWQNSQIGTEYVDIYARLLTDPKMVFLPFVKR